MLCKTSVARSVYTEICRSSIPCQSCDIYTVDAHAIFGIRASACLLAGRDGRPIMTDDTIYFLAFAKREPAWVCMLLLNWLPVQHFLIALAFADAKRPYTRKLP